MHQNPEIYFVVIIGIILGLLLVGFIVTILFLYQKRRQKQEREMAIVKEKYEREVLRSQLEIQENTFKTISQELHDNIGQMLSVAKLSLSVLPIEKDHAAFQPSKAVQEILSKAIFDLSDLTKSLHSDRISEIGLVESMRFDLATIKRAGLIGVNFAINGTAFFLQEQKAIFLFRMFQEIVNNILKHSKATVINVGVSYLEDNTFVLRIEDNGVGFDMDEKKESHSSSKGVGLKSMFNRAQLIGANIEMISHIGKGTIVTITLPANNE